MNDLSGSRLHTSIPFEFRRNVRYSSLFLPPFDPRSFLDMVAFTSPMRDQLSFALLHIWDIWGQKAAVVSFFSVSPGAFPPIPRCVCPPPESVGRIMSEANALPRRASLVTTA